jgi:hypothetical protein
MHFKIEKRLGLMLGLQSNMLSSMSRTNLGRGVQLETRHHVSRSPL